MPSFREVSSLPNDIPWLLGKKVEKCQKRLPNSVDRPNGFLFISSEVSSEGKMEYRPKYKQWLYGEFEEVNGCSANPVPTWKSAVDGNPSRPGVYKVRVHKEQILNWFSYWTGHIWCSTTIFEDAACGFEEPSRSMSLTNAQFLE